MSELDFRATSARVWQVTALCRAIADTLDARFNPVSVRGEISGFSRAASGHCYFSLKDQEGQAAGQIRCAMFRRAASQLGFQPRDGEVVEVSGRLDLYGPRGDLQLIVETMDRAGQGVLFEQFLKLKAKLEAEGLFSTDRKRALPIMPRAIGLVTSLGAAALHDVVTALRRRVPHIQVVLAPALVQGAGSAEALVQALTHLYALTASAQRPVVAGQNDAPLEAILLVRGGGSMDDLWSFNDERLARVIAASPVPVISGVGHETDFTIADFVADVRAPTPTAAAELVSAPRDVWLNLLDGMQDRLAQVTQRALDAQDQRLDVITSRMGRPSGLVTRQRQTVAATGQRLEYAALQFLKHQAKDLLALEANLPINMRRGLVRQQTRLDRAELSLSLLDPRLVLRRGYAWLEDELGTPVTKAAQTHPGQPIRATLVDGTVDLTVSQTA